MGTYNTNITYNTDEDTKESLKITTDNWHQECERMASQIQHIDFDVALLSCASYSMFLGDYIKNVMGKKAIYLGGILNVYFNIFGGRYKKYYDKYGLNPLFQINALENEEIHDIKGGKSQGWNETLNAYFGYK
jgi:hypothetical protein